MFMNVEFIGAPAPWARTKVIEASSGPSKRKSEGSIPDSVFRRPPRGRPAARAARPAECQLLGTPPSTHRTTVWSPRYLSGSVPRPDPRQVRVRREYGYAGASRAALHDRSEEHTSELQ